MTSTATILDSVGEAIAAVLSASYLFASGETTDVTTGTPNVVPLTDDFSELGIPFVTIALAPWEPILQPGNERLHLSVLCRVWRNRAPIAENTNALYVDRDAIADAFIAHAKLGLHDAHVQSAVLMGGRGIEPISVPRGTSSREGSGDRLFLTLPFTVDVRANRLVVPQPA
jgi:hypothetical protein